MVASNPGRDRGTDQHFLNIDLDRLCQHIGNGVGKVHRIGNQALDSSTISPICPDDRFKEPFLGA